MKLAIFLSSIFSLAATLGSLYFSEVLGFMPCKLCWFQRILMYPLFLIFLFQLIQKQYCLFPGIIFSTLGWFLSAYHFALQNEWLGNQEISCSTISCGIKYVEYYGFITIPLLAFIAFSLISFSLIFGKLFQQKSSAFTS